MLNNLETKNIISSLFLIAIFLPIALPPTVSDDTRELIINIVIIGDIFKLFDESVTCLICKNILINPVMCMNCQNVYCKVARSVMPITVGDITITAEMVETAFKVKNGEL